MKTKNMRKKALLSSVAMLLVAVIALGGATYAWFTTNTSVSATGVSLYTDAQSNLQIHADPGTGSAPAPGSNDWSNTVAISASDVQITPMSSYDGKSFFTISTATGTGDQDSFVVNNISANGTPATYSFWVRNQDDGSPLKLSAITTATTDDYLWPGLRVAVFVDSATDPAVVGNPSGSLNENSDYVIQALDSQNGYDTNNKITIGTLRGKGTGAVAACATSGVTIAHKTYDAIGGTTLVASMTKLQAYKITVKFWLEGNVTDNSQIGKAVSGIYISLGSV